MYIKRLIPLRAALKTKSILLLGPRRTGKSALIRNELHPDVYVNLLRSDEFLRYSQNPASIRQQLKGHEKFIVIDEIQKLPILMDEVHDMIESHNMRFLLTGSSARKLKRSHTSLMAGRARRMRLHPFCSAELGDDYDLQKAILRGTMPVSYLSTTDEESWQERLDYAGDYLKEEIMAEAFSRSIDAFARFLTTTAFTNSEVLNFEKIGSDAQVSPRTIREYYAVLEDTLIGSVLEPWQPKKKNRKFVSKSKFYFFDIGMVNALVGRKTVSMESPEFGHLFESLIFNEIQTYVHYKASDAKLNFWGTHQDTEVDFLINEDIAVEVKATANASHRNIAGLQALAEVKTLQKQILVTRDPVPRQIGDVQAMPWRHFLSALWAGEIF